MIFVYEAGNDEKGDRRENSGKWEFDEIVINFWLERKFSENEKKNFLGFSENEH